MKRATAGLSIVLAVTLISASAPSRLAPSLHHVTIMARDYAFDIPTSVPAGFTAFHFVNHGTVPHEVQFFRFNRGVSVAAAQRYLAQGTVPDSAADRSGSVLIAAPGDSVREALLVELEQGERYALLCEFRDAAGKPRHSRLGMVGLIEVR